MPTVIPTFDRLFPCSECLSIPRDITEPTLPVNFIPLIRERCRHCDAFLWEVCTTCEGRGQVRRPATGKIFCCQCGDQLRARTEIVDCLECNGTGKISENHQCTIRGILEPDLQLQFVSDLVPSKKSIDVPNFDPLSPQKLGMDITAETKESDFLEFKVDSFDIEQQNEQQPQNLTPWEDTRPNGWNTFLIVLVVIGFGLWLIFSGALR